MSPAQKKAAVKYIQELVACDTNLSDDHLKLQMDYIKLLEVHSDELEKLCEKHNGELEKLREKHDKLVEKYNDLLGKHKETMDTMDAFYRRCKNIEDFETAKLREKEHQCNELSSRLRESADREAATSKKTLENKKFDSLVAY